MKRVCAWCKKVMGYRKGGKKGDVTHGMCRKCYNKVIKSMGGKQ